MVYATRFVQPIKASLALITSPSIQLYTSKIPAALGGHIRPFNTCLNTLKPQLSYYFKPILQKVTLSGGIYTVGGVFCLSAAVTSLGHKSCVAHCSDDFGLLAADLKSNWSSSPESDRERHAVLAILRKLVVPLFLLSTVMLNWGHPIIIGVKVALLLLSTKPSPSSIYVFVEEMRHQALRKHPIYYSFKSLHTKEVEVEDYTLLCLASVEVSDMSYTVIGILGSWWVLPVSSWNEAQTRLYNWYTKAT